MLDSRRTSELVAAIYDCVIDPDRWPATLGQICVDIASVQGALLLIDPRQNQHVFVRTWNTPADWLQRHQEYNSDLSMIYRASKLDEGWSEDEPMVISRHVPKDVSESSRYFREWCQPHSADRAARHTVVGSFQHASHRLDDPNRRPTVAGTQ